jgi:hypothetical protein
MSTEASVGFCWCCCRAELRQSTAACACERPEAAGVKEDC